MNFFYGTTRRIFADTWFTTTRWGPAPWYYSAGRHVFYLTWFICSLESIAMVRLSRRYPALCRPPANRYTFPIYDKQQRVSHQQDHGKYDKRNHVTGRRVPGDDRIVEAKDGGVFDAIEGNHHRVHSDVVYIEEIGEGNGEGADKREAHYLQKNMSVSIVWQGRALGRSNSY